MSGIKLNRWFKSRKINLPFRLVKIQCQFFLRLANNCLHLQKKMHTFCVNVSRVPYHAKG